MEKRYFLYIVCVSGSYIKGDSPILVRARQNPSSPPYSILKLNNKRVGIQSSHEDLVAKVMDFGGLVPTEFVSLALIEDFECGAGVQTHVLLIWEGIWEKGPIGNFFTNSIPEKLPF